MTTIIDSITAANNPDTVRALIVEHEYRLGKGSIVSDSILIVRACLKHGLPLPPPKIIKGLDNAATKANYTNCVRGTHEPVCSLEEARVAASLVSIRYDGPVERSDRDGSYARHATRVARGTPVRPPVDLVAELEAEIKWQKAQGVAPKIIANKEQRLAKLKEERSI